jgi:hypothetical protein
MKTKLNLLAAGIFLAATSSALATVRYVWQSSPGPAPPYTSWATAAPTIQQAVKCQSSLLTLPGRVGKGCPCRASCALNIPGQCIM